MRCGTHCPFCGETNLTFEDSEDSGDSIRESYSCRCGLWFVEVYRFSHIEDEGGNVVEAAK